MFNKEYLKLKIYNEEYLINKPIAFIISAALIVYILKNGYNLGYYLGSNEVFTYFF